MKCGLGYITFKVYTNLETELFYKPSKGLAPIEQTPSLGLFKAVSQQFIYPSAPHPHSEFWLEQTRGWQRVHLLAKRWGWLLWSDKDTAFSSDFHHLLRRASLNGVWQSSRTGKDTLFTQNPGLVSPSFLYPSPLTPTASKMPAVLCKAAWPTSVYTPHPRTFFYQGRNQIPWAPNWCIDFEYKHNPWH